MVQEKNATVDPQELDKPELYGFRWGPAVVFRSSQYHMGSGRLTRVVEILSDEGLSVEIHVSSTGKSIRVFREGEELK